MLYLAANCFASNKKGLSIIFCRCFRVLRLDVGRMGKSHYPERAEMDYSRHRCCDSRGGRGVAVAAAQDGQDQLARI